MASSPVGHLAPLIKEGPACEPASVCLALLTVLKTLATGPVESLIKKERSLKKKPDFSVRCLKRSQRCCRGHLMADTTWDQKLLNLTQGWTESALCPLYSGTAGGKSILEAG